MIVTADNGSPIRRAQVRVTSPDARESRVATTDAQGRFEIHELPAGRYTMTASKGGFVSLQFGQRRPSESGTPIELGRRARPSTRSRSRCRAAACSAAASPMNSASRSPTPASRRGATPITAGARRMMPAPGANARDTTDDQGQFRLFGLPPGEYYVSAMLRSGGPEVTDPMGELSGYAATYYPGTTNIAEAQRVTVAVSQENTGVHFGLIATRLVRVSGQVMMSDGAPAPNGMVMLVPTSAGGGRAMVMQQGGAGNRIDQTGAFRLPNVAPGRYQVQARAGGREFELARMDLVGRHRRRRGPDARHRAGRGDQRHHRVSDTGEPFDFRAQQLQVVGAARRRPKRRARDPAGRAARASATTGRSALRNVIDPILLRTSAPQGWTLKSVLLNGQDITDTPMEFPPGQTVSGAADRDDQEDDDALGPRHRRARQSGARRHGRGVSQQREALDVSVPVHQGGASGSGRPLPR